MNKVNNSVMVLCKKMDVEFISSQSVADVGELCGLPVHHN
jgi:ribosomal protein L7Ae-like RNA K-turn-binding protein